MRVLVCAIVFCAVSAIEVGKDRRFVIDGFVDIRDIVNYIQQNPNVNFDKVNDVTVGLHLGYQRSNGTQAALGSDPREAVVRFPKISLAPLLHMKKKGMFPTKPSETRRQDIELSNSTIGTSAAEVSSEEVIQIIQEIPVPYPVKIEKNVHYPVPVPYDLPVPIHVSQPYPIRVEKKIPVPVAVQVPQPIPIIKNIPVPVEVPIDNPVPYPVYKSVPFYIQKNVPYPIYKQIPMPVEIPDPVKKEIIVPVAIEKKIPLFVPKPIPYEIKIPIPKTITIKSPYKKIHSNFTISHENLAEILKDAESQKSLEFPVEFTSQNGWTPVFSERKNS